MFIYVHICSFFEQKFSAPKILTFSTSDLNGLLLRGGAGLIAYSGPCFAVCQSYGGIDPPTGVTVGT